MKLNKIIDRIYRITSWFYRYSPNWYLGWSLVSVALAMTVGTTWLLPYGLLILSALATARVACEYAAAWKALYEALRDDRDL